MKPFVAHRVVAAHGLRMALYAAEGLAQARVGCGADVRAVLLGGERYFVVAVARVAGKGVPPGGAVAEVAVDVRAGPVNAIVPRKLGSGAVLHYVPGSVYVGGAVRLDGQTGCGGFAVAVGAGDCAGLGVLLVAVGPKLGVSGVLVVRLAGMGGVVAELLVVAVALLAVCIYCCGVPAVTGGERYVLTPFAVAVAVDVAADAVGCGVAPAGTNAGVVAI